MPRPSTGRIYPESTLRAFAGILSAASQRNSRPIYVISDEVYSRILFSGARFDTPGRYYPRTLLVHTYSKTAMAPGQRIGFVAMPSAMPDREAMRAALMAAGFALGGLPDAIMQYALPEIEQMSIDLGDLQAKRDRMVTELQAMGYQLHVPEATFYLLPRCPIADDLDFTLRLAERGVAVLPGRGRRDAWVLPALTHGDPRHGRPGPSGLCRRGLTRPAECEGSAAGSSRPTSSSSAPTVNRMKALLDIFMNGGVHYDTAAEQTVLSPIEEILRQGQANEDFREFDPRVMATVIQRAVDGLPFLMASVPDLDVDAYAREVATLFDLATRKAR